MAGYTRQSVADIIASAVIRAAPVNAEFNAVRDAFAQATGHTHDGSASEGAYVPLISDTSAFNKVVVDSTNNRISFYSDVSSVAVEQVRIEDGVFVPVTDNDVDLGSASAEFKDLYLDGIGYIDTLAVHENATVAGTLAVTGLSTLASVDIDAGTIDGTAIGSTTPAAGAFTTLSSTTGIASNLIPSIDSTYTLGDASNYWSSAHIDAITTTGNVTVGGALSVTGTADFTNTTLNNVSDPTTAQQAATKAYVDAQVSGLVDAAPGALDTLNELAAAIGDDASFSTTVTNSIATKLPLAGGTMTGNIALGGYLINGAALTPTTASELTSKSYVDSILGSATAVSDTAAAVEATYDAFDDRYLGSKTSAPTLDNDGDTLLTGALYWDSTSGGLYVWNGASWEIAGQRDELLQAIAATKTVTATDVFVYDTSKDSDGGAWRKRTQGTSWYNETLDTSTRGSRKEFPAVAVIVAETNKITIYDGDDPVLPMWMVFTMISADNALSGLSGITSVTARDGLILRGSTPTQSYDLVGLHFLHDGAARIGTTSIYGPYKGNIAERNDAKAYSNLVPTFFGSGVIVNRQVNDVAMTALPDALIDSATGLPVPTIAVATAGGVSVIKDDGTVVDIYPTSIPEHWKVEFVGEKLMMQGAYLDYSPWVVSIPDADVTGWTYDAFPTGITLEEYSTTGSNGPSGANLRFLGATGQLAKPMAAFGSTRYLCTASGLSIIAANEAVPSNGMVAYTTSTYNTGWMNGDIKSAFLSDTDDTDLVGGELVTNGTFDTDSDWTKESSAWTIAGGQAVFDNTGDGFLSQDVGAVDGKLYAITMDVVSITSGLSLGLGDEPSKTDNDIVATGTQTFYLQASGTGGTLYVGGGTNDQITIDNISVQLADADRSVNANGLIVNGTVTRTAVATGADLVAYSGFSASNYLEQPYNSDLDFGTGDFCVMGWLNPVGSGNNYFLGRGLVAGMAMSYNPFNGVWNVYLSSVLSTVTKAFSGWGLFVAVRKDDVLRVYLNGEEILSTASTENVSGTTPITYIGTYDAGSSLYMEGSLALWRISATAHTAEQIAKMYNDEKVLFQENAQATLYGTSDAVTALAHDSDTNLLHVGTSGGRSVFQGLRRVSNTTTAVGTAISASNGLVVEE